MSREPDPKPDEEPYLWDRSGEVNPEIARLEGLLRPLGHDKSELRWTEPAAPQKIRRIGPIAIGAAVLAAAAATLLWFQLPQPGGPMVRRFEAPVLPTPSATVATATSVPAPGPALACTPGAQPSAGFAFESLAGTPTCDGAPAASRGELRTGTWLETDASSRVKLDVANIGHVEIDPSSRLRIVTSRPQEHRLELARGGLRAKIDAPPRLFFVDTKAATAINLGCEYELHVDERGAGMLKVTVGFVELERPKALGGVARQVALVPRHGECTIDPSRGPGTPVWSRASADVREALAKFDATGDRAALDFVLERMTDRDSLTLFHLLDRAPEEVRARIFDRLEKIVPHPPGITRAATVSLEARALAAWRATLEPRWFPKE